MEGVAEGQGGMSLGSKRTQVGHWYGGLVKSNLSDPMSAGSQFLTLLKNSPEGGSLFPGSASILFESWVGLVMAVEKWREGLEGWNLPTPTEP